MDTKDQKPRVYTIKQAAHELLISQRTIFRLINAGKIEAINLSIGRRGIPASEVERVSTSGVLR